jgi:hypothetical protein
MLTGGSSVESVAAGIFTGQYFIEVVLPRKRRSHSYITGEPYSGPTTLIIFCDGSHHTLQRIFRFLIPSPGAKSHHEIDIQIEARAHTDKLAAAVAMMSPRLPVNCAKTAARGDVNIVIIRPLEKRFTDNRFRQLLFPAPVRHSG